MTKWVTQPRPAFMSITMSTAVFDGRVHLYYAAIDQHGHPWAWDTESCTDGWRRLPSLIEVLQEVGP